jgi:hypothetical protein
MPGQLTSGAAKSRGARPAVIGVFRMLLRAIVSLRWSVTCRIRAFHKTPRQLFQSDLLLVNFAGRLFHQGKDALLLGRKRLLKSHQARSWLLAAPTQSDPGATNRCGKTFIKSTGHDSLMPMAAHRTSQKSCHRNSVSVPRTTRAAKFGDLLRPFRAALLHVVPRRRAVYHRA